MPYPGEYRGSPYFYGSGTRAPTIVRRRPAVSPRGGGYEPPFSLGIGPGGNADPSRRGGGYVAPSGIPTNIPGLPQGPQGPAASSLGDYLGQARSMYDPVLRAAADAINRRTELGMGAIGQYTGQLVGMAGQYAGLARQAYQPEIEQGRAVSGWALNALSGAGRNAQVDYKAATRQSGFDPNVQKSGLQQMGKDAGQAAYGIGNAYVDALVASQTASVNRASQEPTWAAGLGEQAKTLLAIQSARALSDQEAQIAAQIPELALNLRSQDIQQSQYAQDYGLRERELTDQEAATRRGIVGRDAPTPAGRQAYWQDEADRRTRADQFGRTWYATPNGINYYRNPNGTPMRNPDWVKNRADQIMLANLNPDGTISARGQAQLKALGVPVPTGVVQPPKRVNMQHVTIGGQAYSFDPTTGYYYSPQGQRVAPSAATPNAPSVNMPLSKALGVWVDAKGNPVPGLNAKGIPAPPQAAPAAAKKTPAPHRVAPGKWRTWDGRPLSPAGNAFWEKKFKDKFTDGKGHLLPGTGGATTASSSSNQNPYGTGP